MNIKKLIAKLPPGYVEDVAGMGGEDMRAAIVQANVNIRVVKSEREHDAKLAGAKEMVRDLSAPYRDAIGAQNAKIAYLLWQLEERGELVEEMEAEGAKDED